MLVSPLRYPGGKAKLFDFFANLIHLNGLIGCRYCEPYAGGAGLALRLLSSGIVDEVELNDVDEAIWAFWTSALDYNREFCELIRHADISIDEWYRQRDVWRAKDTSNILGLGFATFYLNRTNRSGIIEGAGPVGGYAQAGLWKLGARFDPEKQAAAVAMLSPFRSRIRISRLDALDFLHTSLSESGSLTYLDPPYYVKGSKLYRNYYKHSDHLAVRDAVSRNQKSLWVVSYDAVQPIIDIYEQFSPILYSLSYSAGANTNGKEVIYLSPPLRMPDVEGYARIAA